MSETVVIANPAAAAGRVGRTRELLQAQITEALGPCRFVETERAGHATTLARDAAEKGVSRVLSLGGDGTHHEVVNGLMEHRNGPRVAFGVLPAGTGGDLRRTLGVMTLEDALKAIKDRPVRSVDVGHARFTDDAGEEQSRWFVNLASCGMSGLVDRIVNTSSKRLGGAASFYLGTLRAMAQYRPARVSIKADGRDLGVHTISLVVVGNGQYAGGGMRFCPEAQIDDGVFDLVVVPDAGVVRSVMRTPKLYDGTIAKIPGVVTARVREVTIEMIERTAWLDLDGEAPGKGPVTFRAHAGRLRLAGAPT